MNEKKSFYEIITEHLEGLWCEGLALIDVSSEEISISNIFSVNGEKVSIDDYPISLRDKIFTKVTIVDYKEAKEEFLVNNKCMISPSVFTEGIITFDDCRSIKYGGNVYCHTENGKVIVNDKHTFESLQEIIDSGLISDKEVKGKWKVF